MLIDFVIFFFNDWFIIFGGNIVNIVNIVNIGVVVGKVFLV